MEIIKYYAQKKYKKSEAKKWTDKPTLRLQKDLQMRLDLADQCALKTTSALVIGLGLTFFKRKLILNTAPPLRWLI